MIDRRAFAVLTALVDGGPGRFTDLRRVVRNPRTLSAKLKVLSGLGWVESPGGAYRATPLGERAAALLRQLGTPPAPVPGIDVARVPHPLFRPLLQVLVEHLLDRFEGNLRGLLLFGSVARGDWTRDSDIDLLILFRTYPPGLPDDPAPLLAVRKALRETPEYRRAFRAGYVPTATFFALDVRDASQFRRLYLDALTDGLILFERDGALTDLAARVQRRLVAAGARRVEVPGRGHHWSFADPALLEGAL